MSSALAARAIRWPAREPPAGRWPAPGMAAIGWPALVGNDVVDLRDPEARPETLSPRFDARVFDAEERRALAGSPAPARWRWRAWAAKEAAYKLAVKRSPGTAFAPSRFAVRPASGPSRFAVRPASGPSRSAVHPASAGAGSVRHAGARYAVRETEPADADAIHVIATGARTPVELSWGVQRIPGLGAAGPEAPGREARRLCIESLAARWDVPARLLAVGREGRIPRLWLRGEPLAADLSLSHHGELVAYACALARPAAEILRRTGIRSAGGVRPRPAPATGGPHT